VGTIRAVLLTLPAIVESVPRARRAVVEAARAAGAGERVLADVALAVSEACTNVVEHAYRERPEPGTLSVCVQQHGSALAIVVSDEGSGVSPRDDSPGLGMGMALMAAVADGLQIDHDGVATRLHLTFELTAGDDDRTDANRD
jgi:anti-sigma regulatory factor (Ser/Thr protein kinase)